MLSFEDPEQPRQYFFVVTRDRPDLLARARERFGSDPRVEIVPDRRKAERRRLVEPPGMERRSADRRRASPVVDDRVRPTLLARKRLPTYAELMVENDRLQRQVQALKAFLLALTAADAIRRTSTGLATMARQAGGDAH